MEAEFRIFYASADVLSLSRIARPSRRQKKRRAYAVETPHSLRRRSIRCMM